MKILIDNGHGENTPGKRSPENYTLGHEYALSTFLRSSAITYTPIAIIGFIIRKCKEYDIKHKGN